MKITHLSAHFLYFASCIPDGSGEKHLALQKPTGGVTEAPFIKYTANGRSRVTNLNIQTVFKWSVFMCRNHQIKVWIKIQLTTFGVLILSDVCPRFHLSEINGIDQQTKASLQPEQIYSQSTRERREIHEPPGRTGINLLE